LLTQLRTIWDGQQWQAMDKQSLDQLKAGEWHVTHPDEAGTPLNEVSTRHLKLQASILICKYTKVGGRIAPPTSIPNRRKFVMISTVPQ
jgi:hypothetical protein